MPVLYDIVFLPGGEVQQFGGSRGNYYELEDGNYLDLDSFRCGVRDAGDPHGEDLGSLEKLDQELADLDDSIRTHIDT